MDDVRELKMREFASNFTVSEQVPDRIDLNQLNATHVQAQEKLQSRLVECEEKWGELANMNCAQERDGLLAH